jgi:hypothetical protein
MGYGAILALVPVLAIARAQGSQPQKRGFADGKRWALVVGVSQYESERINPLSFAVADARDLSEVLRAHGYTVITMTSGGDRAARRRKRSVFATEIRPAGE